MDGTPLQRCSSEIWGSRDEGKARPSQVVQTRASKLEAALSEPAPAPPSFACPLIPDPHAPRPPIARHGPNKEGNWDGTGSAWLS